MNNKPFANTPAGLLQRQISKRERQVKQYRKELEEAEFNLSLYKSNLELLLNKYTNIGNNSESLEVKLLCGAIANDTQKIIDLADL